jgi:hypothetical protein
VPIFLPVAWMRRMCFTWAKDVDARGAGHVARSSVGIITMPPQVISYQEPRIRMTNVVGLRKDSSPRTTVQEDTVAIVIRGGEGNILSHKYSLSPETPFP